MAWLEKQLIFLKGIGEQKAKLLSAELGLETIQDLIQYYPFRYEDRTKIHSISSLQPESHSAQIKGQIVNIELVAGQKGKRLVALLSDGTGIIELVWFQGIEYAKRYLILGEEVVAFGKPNFFKGKFSLPHPEINTVAEFKDNSLTLFPVYPLTEKLRKRFIESRVIAQWVKSCFDFAKQEIEEIIPDSILQPNNLIDRLRALENIHFPPNQVLLDKAIYRLKFEELFINQLRHIRIKGIRQESAIGPVFSKLSLTNKFLTETLEFDLTNAQKRVVKEIRQDFLSGKQMNRLVQGDVGSGKTVVAFVAMLMALDNGYQACLMAPTEILADQHFKGLSQWAEKLGISIEKLTGVVKGKKRKAVLESLASGELNFVVGTHALLEDSVAFQNIGLSIIDEQHRFGVAQRAKLWNKNKSVAPHVLVMTATPIPRTLAMTFYGDLDVSVIDELPPNRRQIKTTHVFHNQQEQVNSFLESQLQEGRQVYIVYPLIEESETLDFKHLNQGYEQVKARFQPHGFKIAMVHGQMPRDEREAEMERFKNLESHIMVATTVIEVGVNVPNASVMIIESAERFGLAQLHQLRGRVGRGNYQSYCILKTDYKLGKETKERLATMVRTTDGFEIAEVDLRLRGPGDLLGTKQSGDMDFKLAQLSTDQHILTKAREAAISLFSEDPELMNPETQNLKHYLSNRYKADMKWKNIS